MDRLDLFTPQPGVPRAPGLHFVELTRERAPRGRPERGVPLFVGFGERTAAAPLSSGAALEIDRWEQCEAWIRPEPRGYLGEAVREATGHSPGELIRQAYAVEAMRLLAGTRRSVAQVGRSNANCCRTSPAFATSAGSPSRSNGTTVCRPSLNV